MIPRENVDYSQVPILHATAAEAAADDVSLPVHEVTDARNGNVVAVVIGAADPTEAKAVVVAKTGHDTARRALNVANYPNGSKHEVRRWMRPNAPTDLPNAETTPPPPATDTPVVERPPVAEGQAPEGATLVQEATPTPAAETPQVTNPEPAATVPTPTPPVTPAT